MKIECNTSKRGDMLKLRKLEECNFCIGEFRKQKKLFEKLLNLKNMWKIAIERFKNEKNSFEKFATASERWFYKLVECTLFLLKKQKFYFHPILYPAAVPGLWKTGHNLAGQKEKLNGEQTTKTFFFKK